MTELILSPNESDETRDAAIELLDSLSGGAIIKALNENTNPAWPSVFLKTGGKRDPWLALDPSDRNDGESTESSAYIVRHEGRASITILDRGPAAVVLKHGHRRLSKAVASAIALADDWDAQAVAERNSSTNYPQDIAGVMTSEAAEFEERARQLRKTISEALGQHPTESDTP